MNTNLRLLLDESVTDVLAEQIQSIASGHNIEYCRDLPIKGAADSLVVDYARKNNRIVITTETAMNQRQFPICTHPGIIVIAGKRRHESIHAGIFKKFLLSGHRVEARDAVTFLSDSEMRIKNHRGDVTFSLK